ncbi:hypothetical protein bcere0019_8550 [Bacillus cereus Rock3-28]|nr:hypothetical protein bcere0019_8550 [Bacillus cereus Rock3-28]
MAVFGVAAISFILLIIIGRVLALNFHVKDQQTTSLPKLNTVYKETDDKSKEIDKVKANNQWGFCSSPTDY